MSGLSESNEAIDEDEFDQELELFETECELADLENSPDAEDLVVDSDRGESPAPGRVLAEPSLAQDEYLLQELQRQLNEAELAAANLRYQIAVLSNRVRTAKGAAAQAPVPVGYAPVGKLPYSGYAAAPFTPGYGRGPGSMVGAPTPVVMPDPAALPLGYAAQVGAPPMAHQQYIAVNPGAPMSDPNAPRSLGGFSYAPVAPVATNGPYPGHYQSAAAYGYPPVHAGGFDGGNGNSSQSKVRTVVVGNLDFQNTRKDHLYPLFARCGLNPGDAGDSIVRLTLRPDRNNPANGISFVEFNSARAVTEALALNGTNVLGRRISVTPKRN